MLKRLAFPAPHEARLAGFITISSFSAFAKVGSIDYCDQPSAREAEWKHWLFEAYMISS